MGQFSWLDCTDHETQIVNGLRRTSYLLVPSEFGGGHIEEPRYEGYGDFGGKDAYDMVAIWNRQFLAENPDFEVPYRKKKVRCHSWYPFFTNMDLTIEEAIEAWKKETDCTWHELRQIGIDIACYDEENAALPYPIKVTYDENAVFEEEDFSPSDPDQGWLVESYEEEDDEDEWY